MLVCEFYVEAKYANTHGSVPADAGSIRDVALNYAKFFAYAYVERYIGAPQVLHIMRP